jgi:hypothetical protein
VTLNSRKSEEKHMKYLIALAVLPLLIMLKIERDMVLRIARRRIP